MTNIYTAISIAPVQGFIEKSRKLRDLYGASRILSHLTAKLIDEIDSDPELDIISPGLIEVKKGMPNRILVKGDYSQSRAEAKVTQTWQHILKVCREWIEHEFREIDPNYKFDWYAQWKSWHTSTWEIFWGQGDSISAAMQDLETRKLSRNWTAVNWVGESSTLTGTDSIIHPDINNQEWFEPKKNLSEDKQQKITNFYRYLSLLLELDRREIKSFQDLENREAEGKFLDTNERLSVPELVKRLVTREDIGNAVTGKDNRNIVIKEDIGKSDIHLEKSFTDIVRYDTEKKIGQWTGWFMGDGDNVGDKLKKLATEGEESVKKFTEAMRQWGQDFQETFDSNFGRIIYAGGDDCLGVIYSQDIDRPISSIQALDWLRNFPQVWQKHEQDITVSVGFVWAAPRVPQRDILQHCREAEQKAKAFGKNRVTIRILFNSGQYLDWTVPWEHLDIITRYRDRNGIQYKNGSFENYQNSENKKSQNAPNWSHVYGDLAQLKARHAISVNNNSPNFNLLNDVVIAIKMMDYYFPDPQRKSYLEQNLYHSLVGKINLPVNTKQSEFIKWFDGLINISWQLCS